MKKRLMLPMMAFVFAIGLSFATERTAVDTQADYILLNGVWEEIAEQPCSEGPETCQVQFGDAGLPHDVYDEMDTNTRKPSSSTEPIIIPIP